MFPVMVTCYHLKELSGNSTAENNKRAGKERIVVCQIHGQERNVYFLFDIKMYKRKVIFLITRKQIINEREESRL